MRAAHTILLLAISSALLQAAGSPWLERVGPIITPAEKKNYLALQKPEDRVRFEEDFWASKAITAEEYNQRFAYIDAKFGSGKSGSGANTDQGRVYLALGPPNRVTRLPSSRIFVPIEIWYYDQVPGVLNTELRLMFYQPRSVGFPHLYSPTGDTIRALLVPNAATRSMFGPNDSISESDIRKQLTVPPAEDEVVSAAVNVAVGIRATGNDEILGMVSSPAAMLGAAQKTQVRSRLIVAHPSLDVFQTRSAYGGFQVDLSLETNVAHEIDLEVLDNVTTVYQNQLHLKFDEAQKVRYQHRLDLLPGAYRVLITVDGKAWPYPVTVGGSTMGQIIRVERSNASRETPFEFQGEQLAPDTQGRFASVSLAAPGKVTWMLRQGSQVTWRSTVEGHEMAIVELPSSGVPPGSYNLEAVSDGDSRVIEVQLPVAPGLSATALSFNANLAPASRYASIGHQWLLRGNVEKARQSLQASLAHGATSQAAIELARADALAGDLDGARDRVKAILAAQPDNFEALATFAYIETRLQDYTVAAELYQHALRVQDSPAVRAALARLPQH